MKKWIADVCMFLFALLLMLSSGATLCYQITGSSDPIEKIKKLQSENRRDEALDLVQFYENNKFVDAKKLKELKTSLEYTRVEKCKSFAKGAVTGSVYDTYSGIGAIVSDLCLYGDIRDLFIASIKYFNDQQPDVIVAALSGMGIMLSMKPLANVIVSFSKTTVKYLRRISGIRRNNGIFIKLQNQSLSLKESHLVFALLKKNQWSIPLTTAVLANTSSVKHLKTATHVITKNGNTGRVFVSLAGDKGLSIYSTIPKQLRTIYLKGL